MNEQKKKEILQAKAIFESCPHEIELWYGAARCCVCEKMFGGYCNESPDHVCHYPHQHDDDKEHVVLVDGTLHELTTGQIAERLENDKYAQDYLCIFCGKPD